MSDPPQSQHAVRALDLTRDLLAPHPQVHQVLSADVEAAGLGICAGIAIGAGQRQ